MIHINTLSNLSRLALAVWFAVQINSIAVAAAVTPLQDSPQKRVTRSFTQPIEQSVVASSQTGVIKSSHIKEGDQVRAGDTLAEISHDALIESRRIAVAKSESTAKLDAARSRLRLLQDQKETIESLLGGGHVNKYEVEQKITEYENALAEFRVVEDELILAKLEVSKIDAEIGERMIKSPIDGFVAVIHKQLGEHTSSNEPQYATIVRLDKLKVRFYLDDATLNSVQVGSRVPVLVGHQKQQRMAKVIFVSPIIDPDSGTGRMEVELDNSDLELKSGVVCYWKTSKDSRLRRTASANTDEIKK
jgi:RND family efflux transporter MFP subunit